MRRLLNRGRIGVLAVGVGSLMALQGCQTDVRDTVLGGVNAAATSLATTFINAFFLSIQTQDEGAPTTVQVFDLTAESILA